MIEIKKPEAVLLVSTHCPHCHVLETLLRERMTGGLLGKLSIINIEQSPEVAGHYGVRSVPWLQLGTFIFHEALTPSDLDRWIVQAGEESGRSRYIEYLLEQHKLAKAIEWIEQEKAKLKDVISILANPDAKITVRIGIGAILEHFENTQAIRDIIPELIKLMHHHNLTIRTDVCHYLSLTHSADAIVPLEKMLEDESPQVRLVAKESIEELTINFSAK